MRFEPPKPPRIRPGTHYTGFNLRYLASDTVRDGYVHVCHLVAVMMESSLTNGSATREDSRGPTDAYRRRSPGQ